jgi:DNA polymerase III epsilon subunit-like protein
MKVLIFDTETTGLPQRGAKIPHTQLFPYIVQFSWLVYDDTTMRITNINNHIVKLPEGMDIPQESTQIHGITNEVMRESGEDIKIILKNFQQAVRESQILIAHNIKFDDNMVQCECIRNNMPNIMTENPAKIHYCTMKYGKNITKIETESKFQPGTTYLKAPKLFELHKHYFNTVPQNLHNSLVDIFVCFRCFHVMVYNKDLFDLNTQPELAKNYLELTQLAQQSTQQSTTQSC